MRHIAAKQDVVPVRFRINLTFQLAVLAAGPDDDKARIGKGAPNAIHGVDLQRKIILRLEPAHSYDYWSARIEKVLKEHRQGSLDSSGQESVRRNQSRAVHGDAEFMKELYDLWIDADQPF